MEDIKNTMCSICQEKCKDNNITYTCGHIICFSCSPYLMFHILQTQGLSKSFFLNIDYQYSCLFCPLGKSSIPFDKLTGFWDQGKNPKKNKISFCEACNENPLKVHCIQCDLKYCQACLDKFHKDHQVFKKHTLVNLDEQSQLMMATGYKCKCEAHHQLNFYCLRCGTSICKYCLKSDHENHHTIPMNEILNDNKPINYENKERYLKILFEAFSELRKKLLKSIENKLETHKKEFDENCNKIIESLKKLKVKNNERSENELKAIKSQFSLFENSLSFFSRELKQNAIHPNKIYQLNRFLPDTNDAVNICLKDFIINTDENKELKSIRKTLEYINQLYNEVNFYEFYGENGLFLIKTANLEIGIDKICSDPIELLKKKPSILETNLFNPGSYKSNLSTTYIKNNQSFLAWAGNIYKKDEENTSSWSCPFSDNSDIKKMLILFISIIFH